MTIQVRGPDGATINFPDGTPNAVMQRAMSQHYNTGYSRARGDAEKALGSSTVGKGVLNSGAQGASFGFLDELGGGLAAAKTAAQNALAKTGVVKPAGYGASDAYHATVDADRARMAQFHQAHPVVDTAAQIGGALLAPGVGLGGRAVARGAGLLAPLAENTLARSALVGGAIGAAQGAGNAQGGLGSRLKGAASGGALGAVTGAAVPLAGAALSGAVKNVAAPVATTVARAANKVSGGKVLDAGKTALGRLTTALQKDGATPDAIRAIHSDWLRVGGPTPSTLDIASRLPNGGQNTLGVLRAATLVGDARGVAVKAQKDIEGSLLSRATDRTYALTPGNTQSAAQAAAPLDTQIAALDSAAPQRLLSDAQSSLGITPAQARGGAEAVTAQGRDAARPLFQVATSGTDPVWNQDFADLVQQDPHVRRALATVSNNTRNPKVAGLRIDPDTGNVIAQGVAGDPAPKSLSDTVEMQPTAKTWDEIKKYLSRSVERHPLTQEPLANDQSQFNYETGQAAGDLTSLMRSHIPGYAEALDTSGDYLRPRAAYQANSGALTSSKLPAEDVRRVFADYDPSERQAGQAAFANDIFNLSENGRLTPSSLSTPSAQGKLGAAFSPDQAATLMRSAQQEAGLADRSYQPGLTGERQSFQDVLARRNALDTGATAIDPHNLPANYADAVGADQSAAMSRDTVTDLHRTGARDALLTKIGAQKQGALGLFNALSTEPNIGSNLATTFGEQPAGDYQASLRNMADQLVNARKINPNSGSETAVRAADALTGGGIPNVPTSIHGILGSAIDKVRQASTLTDDERRVLAQLGVSQDPKALDSLLAQFKPPPSDPTIAPWLAPRAAAGSADLMATNGQ